MFQEEFMDDNDDLNEKVMDITQRQKRARILRAHQQKIERARELAKKRMAPEKNIKKRAYAQARQIVRRKFAGARGAEYEKLGPSEKMAIDRAIEKKQALIKKIALRLIPNVKRAEQQRLHSFIKGQALANAGAPEGKSTVSEELNVMFEKLVDDVRTEKQKVDAKQKKSKSPIIQYAKFGEESDNVSVVYQAIAKKAGKSGIDIDVLGEVYDRGMDAWSEDMPVSQQQYAFARVNSFINKGKTFYAEDADLQEATPYVKPHIEKGSTQQSGWKASNKHGRVKYFGMDFKKSAERHADIDNVTEAAEKVVGTNCRNCLHWNTDIEKPVTKEELNANGGLKAPNKEYVDMCKRVDLGTLPGKDNNVKIKGFCEHDDIQDWVTERMCCSQWDAKGMIRDYKGQSPVMKEEGESIVPQTTSPGSKVRRKLEVVDRKPPHGELTKQAEIKKKIIDEKVGNTQNDPKKRLQGTDSLVKAYKSDTPGECNESLNEAFNIAYAAGVGVTLTAADLGMRTQGAFQYHPSVIEEMEKRAAEEVEEEVKTADVKAEVVPAHTKTVVDPKSGALKQVTVPRHVRRAKKNKTIIASGSVTNGEPG